MFRYRKRCGPKISVLVAELHTQYTVYVALQCCGYWRLYSCYCWSRLPYECIILYCKNLHCLKKMNTITQNNAVQLIYIFSKYKQEKNLNLQNSTVFLPFQHLYTSLQCTVHHCVLKTKSLTLSKSRLLLSCRVPTSQLHKSQCCPTLRPSAFSLA